MHVWPIRLVEHHRFLLVLLGLVLLIRLPMLMAPRLGDDHIHRAHFLGSTQLEQYGLLQRSPEDGFWKALSQQFAFFQPGAFGDAIKQYGAVPWWTAENAQLKFFRPLTSLTHWLDYRLWPDTLALMHLHTLLWYLLALYLLRRFYSRFESRRGVVNMGLLIFLLAPGFLPASVWLANRNAIIALVFGLLAFSQYHDWRHGQGKHKLVLSLLFLAMALLSAESGVCIFAYFLAYEISHAPQRAVSNGIKLLPVIALILLWRWLYTSAGFGAEHIGWYVDPVADPLAYAQRLFINFPIMVFSLFTGLFFISPDVPQQAQIYLALLFWVAIAFAFGMIRKGLTLQASTQTLLWGSFFAMIPVSAQLVPEGRLLLFPAVGGCLVLSRAIYTLLQTSHFKRGMQNLLSFYLVTIHIVLAFVACVAASLLVFYMHVTGGDFGFQKYTAIETIADIKDNHVVIVNAPSPARFAFTPFSLATKSGGLPKTIRILAPAFSDIQLTRLTSSSLKLEPAGGFMLQPKSRLVPNESGLFRFHEVFMHHKLMSLFHDNKAIATTGAEFPEMAITVAGVKAEVVQAIEIQLPGNIPGGNYLWLMWDWTAETYVRFELPEAGSFIRVAGPRI